MRVARVDVGITFLDDARYDDETGTAPIPTGYSEVIFGALYHKAGWRRDETVIANKLWWEFWPEQSAAHELDGSLARMQMDHVDLIYANPAPEGLELAELVESVTGLITAGKARAWGVVNWPADAIAEVSAIAVRHGLPQPCAAQLPYSLVQRVPVEDDRMVEALNGCRASVVASFVPRGRSAHRQVPRRPGNRSRRPERSRSRGWPPPRPSARSSAKLAVTLDTSASALAIAFTLANPMVASVLFGATTPQQVLENAAALESRTLLDGTQIAELRRIGRRPG